MDGGIEEKDCLICLKKFGRKEKVFPLPDWANPSIVRYYCKEHYQEVYEFQKQQKEKYERMLEQLPSEYIEKYIMKKDSNQNDEL